MSYSDLFIIGKGFDLAHGMPTKYDDFKRWLIENDRIDIIQELQHAFPGMKGREYLLWSDFETALGQYDIDTVLNWGWDDLYITSSSIGNLKYDRPSQHSASGHHSRCFSRMGKEYSFSNYTNV